MDLLLRHSTEIFDAAEASARAGRPPADFTILIGPNGHIHMVAGSDWPLDSLRIERGADMAFRVCSRDGRVRVTGENARRKCHLETETPAGIARRLLRGPLVVTSGGVYAGTPAPLEAIEALH